MKFLVSCAASVLVAAILLSLLPVHGESEIYEDVLRLHVIAESDGAEDQALKLKVRDAVLAYVAEEVAECETFEEAYERVDAHRAGILRAAENCLRENGADCTVQILLGEEKYPRRDYGNAVLPAGVYPSLRVVLGEGKGQNWWCVLFPTLCLGFASEENASADEDCVEVGFTPAEYRIITGHAGKYKVRFRILEILSELFA